jgi:mRNA interferase RelE/StbE
MSYQVIILKRVLKYLESMPKLESARVFQKIEQLATEPRPQGVKKLVGKQVDLYRVRSGDYRIIYTIDDGVKIVEILKVGHRGEVYN